MYFEINQQGTRSNYLYMFDNICMVISDLASLLHSLFFSDYRSRILLWQRKAQVIFCYRGRYGAGKGSGEQAVSGVGKSRGMGSSFQVPCKGDTGRGLWVTHRREVEGCRVQVSLVGAPGKTVSCGRKGLKSTDLAFSFYTLRLYSAGTRSFTASAGESWLFSISWVLLSPKGSPMAPSPCCGQTDGYEQTFTSACTGIGHFCVSVPGFHVCAHKLHLQFWYGLLREDFAPGRNYI